MVLDLQPFPQGWGPTQPSLYPAIFPPNQDVGGSEALAGWREPCYVVGTPWDKQGWYYDGHSIKQYCSVVT